VQLALDLRLPSAPTFASFVDGPNRLARAWVEGLATGGGPESVYLWGPRGSGKTHLLVAACRAVADSGAPVAYVPLAGEEVIGPGMLGGLEHAALVCLDDLDAVAGRGDWEEALFHLLNRLRHAGTRWIGAGSVAPAGLGLRLPDLESRLTAVLGARLGLLAESERAEALRRRARDRGFQLTDEVVAFLLRRFSRDLPSLFRVLDALDALSLREGRRVSVGLVRTLLEEAATSRRLR
jgi:DnaA family protein